MRLLHYTAEPFTLDRSRSYDEAHRIDKPRGLWVSVEGEDDWESWCRSEDFRPESLSHVTEVVLTADANVLVISNPDELRGLTARFPLDVGDLYPDWARIKSTYDGIIVAPYQWSCRLATEVTWYYTWDCASGCVWNLAAIDSVRAVETAGA